MSVPLGPSSPLGASRDRSWRLFALPVIFSMVHGVWRGISPKAGCFMLFVWDGQHSLFLVARTLCGLLGDATIVKHFARRSLIHCEFNDGTCAPLPRELDGHWFNIFHKWSTPNAWGSRFRATCSNLVDQLSRFSESNAMCECLMGKEPRDW